MTTRLRHTARLGFLCLALALSALADTAHSVRPAHATGAMLFAQGGPSGVWVTGSGFTPGALVRLEVLSSDLTKVPYTAYNVPVNSYGGFSEWQGTNGYWLGPVSPSSFSGDVYIAADGGAPTTVWARSHVYPAPQVSVAGAPYPCGRVWASGYGFQGGDSVRFELIKTDLSQVLDTEWATVDSRTGDVWQQLNVPAGFYGPAYVVLDEGLNAPLTVWARVTTC